jgi:hypothetical protein
MAESVEGTGFDYPGRPQTFRDELAALINKHSLENGSDTPDFLLASYLEQCLMLFGQAVQSREQWYGRRRTGPASNPEDIVLAINAREAASLETLRREVEDV